MVISNSWHVIDFQKINFARQQGGDNTIVYLRPITQRNYFSECLYVTSSYICISGDCRINAVGGQCQSFSDPVELTVNFTDIRFSKHAFGSATNSIKYGMNFA